MRPYDPSLAPETALEAMTLAADIVNKHGLGEQITLADHASNAWRATVESIIYNNLVDNMQDALGRNQADPASADYAASCSQALDDTLAPLHKWTGHNWIGQVLGTVDATNDEALETLLKAAARIVAREGHKLGVEEKGSLLKFLASQHITPNKIQEMIVKTEETQPAVRAEDQPFIDFLRLLFEASLPLLGEQQAKDRVEAAAKGDVEAAKNLLLFGGYAGTEEEIRSALYAAKLQFPQSAQEETPSEVLEEPVETEVVSKAEDAALVGGKTPFTPVEALDYVRQNTGLKDTDMAECLGVSRGTIQNLISGKAKKPMTQEGRAKLADRVAEIGTRLLEAAESLRTAL